MAKALGVSLLSIVISVSLFPSAFAASVEEFYKGKTIQFVVGGSAGGGYDTRGIGVRSWALYSSNRE